MEAIPYFLRALEDDLCRDSAADALRRLGNDALLALVTSALTRLPSAEEERPSSLRRRAKALELIAEIGAGPIVWPLLRPLLDEGHPPIIAGAAKLAIVLGDANDRVRAAQQLLSIIPRADWYLREEIQRLLIELLPEAEDAVEKEYQIQSRLPDLDRAVDPTIRLLEKVRRKARESATEGMRR